MKKIKKILSRKWLLLLIIFSGAVLRFYNLNWDQGHFFHPDERNIALAVSKIQFFSQLNPGFFAYGGFPIYLYRVLGEILVILTKDNAWVSDWGHINLVGRSVSAFFSTLTIFLVFQLGRHVFGQKVGLLSAFFTAFTVSLIQQAHFAVTESLLVFWLVLIILLCFNLLKQPSTRNYVKTGVVCGLAASTKISGLSFFIIPTISHLFSLINQSGKFWKRQLFFFSFLFFSFLFFSLFSPYTFLDWQHFKESMDYESGIVMGRLKVCYVLQFLNTTPYLFQIKNLFWQMGPILAVFGIVGITIKTLNIFLKRTTAVGQIRKTLTLLSWPLVYFAYVGSWYTKFIRYTVPALPFLAIFAAWILLAIYKRWKMIGMILIGFTCLATFLWPLAFFSIYTRESTRIAASKWIYQNIPQGVKILQEHWDDGLPISVNGHHPSEYQTEQLTIYEPDNEEKIQYYAEKLAEADYIVINSRRLYGTLMYLPEKYPITSRYYKLLFAGKLGYTKIVQFTSYPSLLGIEINDDRSEETFQVYDHPKVLVFKNNGRFNRKTLTRSLRRE